MDSWLIWNGVENIGFGLDLPLFSLVLVVLVVG